MKSLFKLLFGLTLVIGQLLTGDPHISTAFAFLAPLIGAGISALTSWLGSRGNNAQRQQGQKAIDFLNGLSAGTLKKGDEAFTSGMAALNEVMSDSGFSPEIRQSMGSLSSFINSPAVAPGQPINVNTDIGSSFNPQTLGNAGVAANDFGLRELGAGSNASREAMAMANDLRGQSVNNARLNTLGDWAENVLRNGGKNAETEQARIAFQKLLDANGQTPETRALSAEGKKLLNAGGMTPALQNIMNTFQSQIQSGGMTAEAKQLFESLMPIVQSRGAGGALLSMDEVSSMARDEAASLGKNTAEERMRQAINRGSAPGTVVGSGLQNQALAEADDAILGAQAAGMRDARLKQQQLQLQQFLGASGVAGDVTKTAAGLVASANTGLGDVARASSQNVATGGGMLGQAGQIGAANMGTAASGLGNIFNTETQRMGIGSSLSLGVEGQRRELTSQALQALGLSGNLDINQNQQALSALGIPINALLQMNNQNVEQRGQDVTYTGNMMQFISQDQDQKLRAMFANLGASNDAINRILTGGQINLNAAADFFKTSGSAAGNAGAIANGQPPSGSSAFWNSLATGGANMAFTGLNSLLPPNPNGSAFDPSFGQGG